MGFVCRSCRSLLHHFPGEGFYPVNVPNLIQMVPEVYRIFCTTANPTEVVLAEAEKGQVILCVMDEFPLQGIKGDEEIK